MKRLLYLSYFLIFSSLGFSQANFTSDDIPYLGDRDSLRFLTYHPIDNDLINETGNNYQWDFSLLPFSTFPNFVDTVAYRAPQHAISLSIEGATMEDVSYGPSGGHLNVYGLRNDSLILYRQGGYLSGGQVFNPPVVDMVFPLAFGNQFESYVEFLMTNGGGNTVYTGNRSIIVDYDGYGVLSLPWGTYSDVFRIHKIVTDSTYSTGFTVTYDTYTWYKKGGYVPLLSLKYTFSDNRYNIFASKGGGSLPNSIRTVDKESLKVYPLPFSNHLKMEGCKALSAKMFSITGQLVAEYDHIINNTLDVSNIESGVFVLKVVDDDKKVFSIKVLK